MSSFLTPKNSVYREVHALLYAQWRLLGMFYGMEGQIQDQKNRKKNVFFFGRNFLSENLRVNVEWFWCIIRWLKRCIWRYFVIHVDGHTDIFYRSFEVCWHTGTHEHPCAGAIEKILFWHFSDYLKIESKFVIYTKLCKISHFDDLIALLTAIYDR